MPFPQCQFGLRHPRARSLRIRTPGEERARAEGEERAGAEGAMGQGGADVAMGQDVEDAATGQGDADVAMDLANEEEGMGQDGVAEVRDSLKVRVNRRIPSHNRDNVPNERRIRLADSAISFEGTWFSSGTTVASASR